MPLFRFLSGDLKQQKAGKRSLAAFLIIRDSLISCRLASPRKTRRFGCHLWLSRTDLRID
jgi:hypothetical protein